MEPKFKVGDRVSRVDGAPFTTGDREVTVTEITGQGAYGVGASGRRTKHMVWVDRYYKVSAGEQGSVGGSTGYYKLPANVQDLQDLIEQKGMSFARGNIFKACYRLGEKDGTTALYDINKIIFFAERMKKMLEDDVSL